MKKIFILSSLIAALFATPSFADPTELDKKTVASKAYVDTKQDIITTGLVVFEDGAVQGGTSGEDDLTVRALVATNAAGTTLTGNTIGILDANTLDSSNGGALSAYAGYGAEMDNFVPTVRAVADAIKPPLEWSSTQSNAINAYNTTFGSGTDNWAGNSDNLITGRFLANSLALKQNKLAAKTSNARAQAVTRSTAGDTSSAYITAGGSVGLTTRSGAPAVINYVNGTVATTEDMTTFTSGTFGSSNAINQKYIKNALVSLELLKDVYGELNSKITNNALPTGTTGTVVTYNGVNAETGVQEFGERAVYDPANTYNAQTDATKLATAGFVETKQNKMVCAGWDSETHTDEHCWLWSIE